MALCPKLPQVYASHVNMSHNKFKADFSKTATAVLIALYEGTAMY